MAFTGFVSGLVLALLLSVPQSKTIVRDGRIDTGGVTTRGFGGMRVRMAVFIVSTKDAKCFLHEKKGKKAYENPEADDTVSTSLSAKVD